MIEQIAATKFYILAFILILLGSLAASEAPAVATRGREPLAQATACQPADISILPATHWESPSVGYFERMFPGGSAVTLEVRTSAQATLQQRITVQAPDSRTFQCVKQASDALLLRYDWWERNDFSVKFDIQMFNQQAWQEWGCNVFPVEEENGRLHVNYACGETTFSFTWYQREPPRPSGPRPGTGYATVFLRRVDVGQITDTSLLHALDKEDEVRIQIVPELVGVDARTRTVPMGPNGEDSYWTFPRNTRNIRSFSTRPYPLYDGRIGSGGKFRLRVLEEDDLGGTQIVGDFEIRIRNLVSGGRAYMELVPTRTSRLVGRQFPWGGTIEVNGEGAQYWLYIDAIAPSPQ